MARKKKTEVRHLMVLTHICRRCGFEREEIFDDDAQVDMSNKRCPRCHTHMPCPQVTHMDQEV